MRARSLLMGTVGVALLVLFMLWPGDGPGLRPPAPVGLADEPRQGRLDAVVERPPPADRAGPAGDGLGPEVGRAGRVVRAVAERGEGRPDEGAIAGLAGVAPGAQGDEPEDEVESAPLPPDVA